MSVLHDGAFVPLRMTASRLLGCGAGFALAAAVGFFAYEAAPGAPAIIPTGLAGVSGLAVLALAFTLDDAALSRLTKAVAAGVGLLVLCAARRCGGEAKARQFRVRCVRRGARHMARPLGADTRQRFMAAGGAVRRCACAVVRLCGLSRARLARPDDRRFHDLSRLSCLMHRRTSNGVSEIAPSC